MLRLSVTITQLSLQHINNRQRLSAVVDNELLYLDFPNTIQLEARGEAFIAIALLEAMVSNLPLELSDDIPVSPLLIERLDKLQDIYCFWNTDLHKVEITGGKRIASSSNQFVGCFYSGGVDGAYSFSKHINEVTHLITLSGFDVLENKPQWQNVVSNNQSLADKMSVSFVDIENNFRQFSEQRKISKFFVHGLILAGAGVTLGFSKVYIPTGLTIDNVYPWSCHPLTDPLWGIEHRKLVHDGIEVSRSDKLKYLANFPDLLNNLQVCWSRIDHNCGQCSKCIRTRASLHLLNMTCERLAAIEDINLLKGMTINGISGLPVIEDLLVLAKQQNRPKEAAIFQRIITRYKIKYHLEELAKLLLGQRLKNVVSRFSKDTWRKYRVTMEGKKIN
ncbi:hypothetical protein [Litorilituus lipolyticus]|uniref:Uncharacterized protein n=1 Tax=Litorilituus lipolyticus TaxID=2491017 RepID=A0A502KUI1_9GAMM|nr:hypothetical protein [Litorilituus lipolyticus]TPH13303.1 hypothetical protein EPA86_14005 [Litorilituus lipolyticus]